MDISVYGLARCLFVLMTVLQLDCSKSYLLESLHLYNCKDPMHNINIPPIIQSLWFKTLSIGAVRRVFFLALIGRL